MFSYIDPSIVDLLLFKRKLVHLDREGCALPPEGEGRRYLSLLGPVPLPVGIVGTAGLLGGAATRGLEGGVAARGLEGDADARGFDGPGPAEALFQWYAFVRHAELDLIEEVAERVRRDEKRDLVPLLSTFMQVSSVLVHGGEAFATAAAPLVRVHSSCMTSDVFGSRRCECGPQLHAAFAQIVREGVGAVIYMSSHEGRGIGLWAKAVTYLLQDMGQDTYQANTALGLPEDSRDFADAAVVLRYLRPGAPRIRLLTNNPLKVDDLAKGGIDVAQRVPLVVGFGRHNLGYMRVKRDKGHQIPAEAVEAGSITSSPHQAPKKS